MLYSNRRMKHSAEPSSQAPRLRFTEGTQHIWDTLAALPRTGWVQWGIPNPETVAEHIHAIRALALDYREHLALDANEFQDMLDIIEVHDWPEAIVGDLVIMGDEPNVAELKADKKARERAAMEQLCQKLPKGAAVLALYLRYEEGQDHIARYAKELDKLQAVLLAADYEKQYGKAGLRDEFVTYTRKSITIPFLQAELERVAAVVL